MFTQKKLYVSLALIGLLVGWWNMSSPLTRLGAAHKIDRKNIVVQELAFTKITFEGMDAAMHWGTEPSEKPEPIKEKNDHNTWEISQADKQWEIEIIFGDGRKEKWYFYGVIFYEQELAAVFFKDGDEGLWRFLKKHEKLYDMSIKEISTKGILLSDSEHYTTRLGLFSKRLDQ